MQATKSAPSIERALAILEVLDQSRRSMNIAELSRRLKIPRSSAHVITLTLERCGYLTRDASQRNCRLSLKAFHLGKAAVPAEQLAIAARKPMQLLSESTQLTSHLAILDQDQVMYIQKVEGPGPLRFDTHIGKRTNLHCTAVGKVLLGYAPKAYQQRILSRAPFARYTRNTMTGATVLGEELVKVTRQGYAVNNQEEELEVQCLAVPVFSTRGELVASLSISGTSSLLKEAYLVNKIDLLQRTGRQIAHQLQLEAKKHPGFESQGA
jgi:IclR family KDG regulon transcriptional repressor